MWQVLFNFIIYFGFFQFCFPISISKISKSANNFGLLSRLKRTEDGTCISECANSYRTNTNNVSTALAEWYERKENATYGSNLWPTKEVFREYCREIVLPYLGCLDGCPASNSKIWHDNLVTVDRFLCVDWFQEIFDNYNCWIQADHAMQTQCPCTKLYLDDSMFNKFDNDLYQTCNYEDYKMVLDDHCQSLTCRQSCAIFITKKYCGVNMTDLIVNDLPGLTVRTIGLDLLMTNKFKSTWPYHCTQLLQYTGYNAPSRAGFIIDICENRGMVSFPDVKTLLVIAIFLLLRLFNEST